MRRNGLPAPVVVAACVAGVVAHALALGTATRASAGTAAPTYHVAPRSVIDARLGFDATPRQAAVRPILIKANRGDVFAYPPGKDAAKDAPLVIYLHGVHGRAENGCPWMRTGRDDMGWLVCPEAQIRVAPGWSWTGRVERDAPVVHTALTVTRSDAPRVAVGFSQGAYLTLDLIKKKKESFKAIVLLGASVNPDASELRAAGVERVVLGASEDEPWHATLERRAESLKKKGVDVRFVSLGHVGHMYVGEGDEQVSALREAIAWASEN